jgi:hypothetical protein
MNRYLMLSAAALLAMPVLQNARADDYTPSVHGIQQNAQAYVGAYERASRWETVEADNGSIYKVDLGHIEVIGRGVRARLIKDEGDEVLPYSVAFDCGGHYYMSGLAWQYAPPRSVIGRIATLSCATRATAPTSKITATPSTPTFCNEPVPTISAQELSKWENASRLAGGTAEGMDRTISKLTDELQDYQTTECSGLVGGSVSTPQQPDNRPTVDQWLTAGNYDIDVNSIKRSATSATATVKKDGKVATLVFDCRGHFQDAADLSRTQIAPPGSIASSVANTVCATSHQTAQGR